MWEDESCEISWPIFERIEAITLILSLVFYMKLESMHVKSSWLMLVVIVIVV